MFVLISFKKYRDTMMHLSYVTEFIPRVSCPQRPLFSHGAVGPGGDSRVHVDRANHSSSWPPRRHSLHAIGRRGAGVSQ